MLVSDLEVDLVDNQLLQKSWKRKQQHHYSPKLRHNQNQMTRRARSRNHRSKKSQKWSKLKINSTRQRHPKTIKRKKMKLKILNQLSIRRLRSRLKSRKANPLKILHERKRKITKTKLKSSRVRATSLRQYHIYQHPKCLLSNLNSWMQAKRNGAKTNQRCKSQASKRFSAHLLTKAIRDLLSLRTQAIILTPITTKSMILVKAVQNKGPNEANPKATKAYK